VQYIALRQELNHFVRNYKWGDLPAALAAAAAAGFWVRLTGLRPIVTLVISAICFFGAFGGFLLWRKEEILTDSVQSFRQKIQETKDKKTE